MSEPTENSTAGNVPGDVNGDPDAGTHRSHGQGGKGRSRRHKLLVGGVVAGLLAGGALAVHATGGHGSKGFGPGKGMMMKSMMSLIETVDTDQSGTVSTEEIEALRSEKFANNDANGSGDLTLEEFQSLWLEMARPVMVDHFQFLDHDGDGIVTREEFDRPVNRLVTVLDRDGDGEITFEEVRSRRGGHRGHHDT